MVRSPVLALRAPLLAAALAALVAGVLAGLARLGWDLPPADRLAMLHGPLMVSGFFGALISLERAVAVGRPAAYLAPLAAGLAGLLAIASAPAPLAAALWTLAAFVLTVLSAAIARRQPALFTIVLAAGAAAWLVGNALLLAGIDIADLVLWWVAFLVLTIAAERQEMSRLMPPAPASRILFAIPASLLVAAAALAGVGSGLGRPLAGVALLGLTLWLLRHDIARRTIRNRGLPRFSAVCLLSGYVWLAAAGLLALAPGDPPFRYDAFLHAIFVGFVVAMVFGHGPIILPAVARLPVAFGPSFYAPLALLHLAQALRVAGDLVEAAEARRWGGLLTAAALILFAAVMLAAVRRGRRA
jgi:hypothetical protein